MAAPDPPSAPTLANDPVEDGDRPSGNAQDMGAAAGGEGDGAGPGEDGPERLAAAIGVAFRDPGKLRLALTHRSVLHEWAEAGLGLAGVPLRSNERLEFLGDALLGAIVADHLYATEPDADEGALTRARTALVRTETLVRWAREIDLGAYLYLGHGERPSEGARDRMLAGAFEALVGAIALDRGMREAKRFVRRFLARESAAAAGATEETNPKGRLQELTQERHRRAPAYRTLVAEGPDHARVFTVEVTLDGRPFGAGSGGSKRDAEQAAARAGLAYLAAGGDPLAVAPVERRRRSRRAPAGESTDDGAGTERGAAGEPGAGGA